MPHGTSDWWGVEPTSTVHQVQDSGELAARLGSPVTYDRRGNVVFVDSFHEGLTSWIAEYSGTGGASYLSSEAARTGAYSAKLLTGKTSGMSAGVTKYQPRPVLGKIGLEGSFAPISSDPEIQVHIYHYTGTGYYLFKVRYDYATQALQYFDDAGVWQNLGTGLAFWPNYTSFNPLKLVVNLSTNEYDRVLFNDTEYSVAGEGGYWVAGASAPYLALYLAAIGDTSDNYTVYLDDVVFTQNEP